jgi:hypothetical protein
MSFQKLETSGKIKNSFSFEYIGGALDLESSTYNHANEKHQCSNVHHQKLKAFIVFK